MRLYISLADRKLSEDLSAFCLSLCCGCEVGRVLHGHSGMCQARAEKGRVVQHESLGDAPL
eukprot:5177814-Prymnesium_polylepis.1